MLRKIHVESHIILRFQHSVSSNLVKLCGVHQGLLLQLHELGREDRHQQGRGRLHQLGAQDMHKRRFQTG